MNTEELVAAAHYRQVLAEQDDAGCTHAERIAYDETFDAFYCPDCDIWLEPLCDDPTCGFCTKIPLRPSYR